MIGASLSNISIDVSIPILFYSVISSFINLSLTIYRFYRLGISGIIGGVDIDTLHFTGMYDVPSLLPFYDI